MDRPVLGPAHTQINGQHGWLQVNGIRYEHDIIIHSDGLVTERNCGCSPVLRAQLSSSYKADYFHSPLTEFELDLLKEEEPEVVIIGSGFLSMMPITPLAKAVLADHEHYVLSTQMAMDRNNKECRKFVAILHLSC